MATVALSGNFTTKVLPKHGSMASVVYVKKEQYSNKPNIAAYKRGTGGFGSFNGVVATVFGCSGFVGRYVCNKLGKSGTQMILPYRSDFYEVKRLKVCGDLGQVLFTPFDLRDEESIAKAVRYSNVVINLIGRDFETKNFKYNDVHVDGARRLARICREEGVDRFIHLTYLNAEPNPKPLVLRKTSGYKTSHYFGELAVREEFPTATIFRASDIYGQEDRFLRTFAATLRIQGEFNIPLYKKGEETIKRPVYVGDVAAGIVNAAKDPETKCQTYQAVGPKAYLLGDLVDWIFGLMRKEKKYGYNRYDMKYDPIFAAKVTALNLLSPAYPFQGVHWDGLEKESTTDVVKAGVPTLEDLDVTLTPMEHQAPWELHPFRAFQNYMDKLGEFPKPPPPKVYSQ